MAEFISNSSYFGVVITLFIYLISVNIKKKVRHTLFNPMLITIVVTILILLLFDISYESYNSSAKYISYLLTPTTICLALPLYEQLDKLKENFTAIMLGILSGVLTSMGSVLILCKLFELSKIDFVTLLPKSITSAIGMYVSEEFGGYVSITVAVIILTGLIGSIISETIMKVLKIKNRIAKGVAMGTAFHAIGTSKAMEIGEIEGAIASLSIVVAGLMTVLLAGIFVGLY